MSAWGLVGPTVGLEGVGAAEKYPKDSLNVQNPANIWIIADIITGFTLLQVSQWMSVGTLICSEECLGAQDDFKVFTIIFKFVAYDMMTNSI
jgi:hypothetical protein